MFVAVIENGKSGRGKVDASLMIKFVFVYDQVVKKFSDVRKTSEGHIFIDGGLMFNENKKMIVDGARDVIFLFVEEQTVKGVDVQFVKIGVVSVENGVTKREQANGFIEVGTKNRIAIF